MGDSHGFAIARFDPGFMQEGKIFGSSNWQMHGG